MSEPTSHVGRLAQRRESQASTIVPAGALNAVNSYTGALIDMFQERSLGEKDNKKSMKSFQDADREGTERFQGSQLVGTYGMMDTMHHVMRNHILQLHRRYKEPLLETLAEYPWAELPRFEMESLHQILINTRAVLGDSPPAGTKQFAQTLERMNVLTDQALSETPNRATKAKLFLELGTLSVQFDTLKHQKNRDEAFIERLEEHIGQLDALAKISLTAKEIMIHGDEPMPFTLRNNKGEAIMLSDGTPATATIDPNYTEPTLIDFAIGGVGASGVLNKKFLMAYQEAGAGLIGNADATMGHLIRTAQLFKSALQQNHPNVPKEELDKALSDAGLNFSPSTWKAIKNEVKAKHPQTSFDHTIDKTLNGIKTPEGPIMTLSSKAYGELLEQLGIAPLDEQTLIPQSRHDYVETLQNMQKLLALNSNMPALRGEAGAKPDNTALERSITTAKEHLMAQPDEARTLPSFHKASALQGAPDVRMREALWDVQEKMDSFEATNEQYATSMQGFSALLKRGLEQAHTVKIGGPSEGVSR